MYLRKAAHSDLKAIMHILDEARLAQRAMGFVQWTDGYPSAEVVAADIDHDAGYILVDGDNIAGYAAIADGDDEYDRLTDIWRTKDKYSVIHRIGIGDKYRGQHVSAILFDLMEAEILSRGARLIRIDTGTANKTMQHILAKRGYENLGVHDFVWGQRLAYEKRLS